MLGLRNAATAIIGVLLLTGTAIADDYSNARFGYSFDVPENFYPIVQDSENGDGQSFLSLDQTASLIAYGGNVTAQNFVAEVGQQTQFAKDAGWNITYEAGGPSWGVYSGLNQGQILYVRLEAQCDGDQYASIWLIFNEIDRAAYEPLTSELRTRLSTNPNC